MRGRRPLAADFVWIERHIRVARGMEILRTGVRNYGDVFFSRGSGCEVIGFCVELGKQIVKIATRESPFEGLCGFFVAFLEPDQIAFENRNGREVIGVEKLALDN